MRKHLLFLLLVAFTGNIFAQDIIIKRNGDELKSRVLEITSESIKYKEFEFQDGPIRNLKISEVFMIIYENGKRESFAALENKNPKQVTKAEVPVVKEVPVKRYKGNYFMLGNGLGNSYGGIGLRVQGRFGGKTGFGFHGGVGYRPDGDKIFVSGGIKFFPYKGIYLNTQFGYTGYEKYSSSYYTSAKYKLLYGPSFLVGIDQVWGRRVGLGFNAGLGVSYNINTYTYTDYDFTYTSSSFALAFDLGFIVRF
jgi:hypothetical protein